MRIQVAFCAALSICMASSAAMAGAADIYSEAIAKYDHVKYGVPVARELKLVRVRGVTSVAMPCPAHTACKRPGRAFLVGFSEGDGGGEALEFRKVDAPCADCITSVAFAGGGALGRKGLMSYGLTAAQATALDPHHP